jgi:transposase-like protein
MKRKSEKGKIARDRWPRIVERYSTGGTLAELAREYGCTPPAIRYILTKAGALSTSAPPLGQPHRDPQEKFELSTSGRTALPQESAHRLSLQERAKGGGVVDVDLRKRVSADIANFLVSIDQAVADDLSSINSLEDAIDRLMRSAARMRIELERWLVDSRAGGHEEGTLETRFRAGVAQ